MPSCKKKALLLHNPYFETSIKKALIITSITIKVNIKQEEEVISTVTRKYMLKGQSAHEVLHYCKV